MKLDNVYSGVGVLHKSMIKFASLRVSGIPLLALCLISAASVAGVFDPAWRGDAKTVYTLWDNWTYQLDTSGNFIFTPDIANYGEGTRTAVDPQAVQLAAPVSGPPVEVLGSFDSRYNVLKLNKQGMYINLPNFPEGDYLLLHFEISYYTAYADFTGFYVTGLSDGGVLPGYDEEFIAPKLVNSVQNGNWVTEAYEFTMDPNPTWENLEIVFSHYPALAQDSDAPYIDYFSFDTIVVPEPTSVILLALGAFLIWRKN